MSDFKITFLGTGSARPTPYRGCAALAMAYDGDTLLFDCGEGTQLKVVDTAVRLSRTRAICITHFHGDHINGLPGLLGSMGLNGFDKRLVLAGPPGMDRYLSTLAKLNILRPSFPIDLVPATSKTVLTTDAYRIDTCPLDHRIPCWGYMFIENDLPGRFDLARARELEIPKGPIYGQLQRGQTVTLDDGRTIEPNDVLGASRAGRRVAYISDTRPSDTVANFVHGADVLIHESTYLHEFRTQAYERGHSTCIDAAKTALKADVKQLVLTHISTKHMRPHELLREARAVFPNTVIAADGMEMDLPIPE